MTEKVWDRCPKCSAKLTNKVECKSCGLIFEKYFQAEARKKAQAERDAENKKKSRKRALAGLACLAVLGIAFGSYSLWERTGPGPQAKKDLTPPENSGAIAVQTTASPERPKSRDIEITGKGGDDGQSKHYIQNASNATVTVQTPWGVFGSGFFISENSVVTNRHVVEFNNKSLDDFRNKIEKGKQEANLESAAIRELKERIVKMPEGPEQDPG